MIDGALVYLVTRGTAGKLRRMLRQLREPRYLVGALLGSAYVYFFMLRPYTTAGEISMFHGSSPEVASQAARALAAAGILLVGLTQVGSGEEGIAFRDEELSFLLAAPLPRWRLLLYRVLDAQPGILGFGLVMGYAMSAMPGGSWLGVPGALLLLELMMLLRIWCALALGGLRHRGWSPWWLRGQAYVALAAIAGAAWWTYQAQRAAGADPFEASRDPGEGPMVFMAGVAELASVDPLRTALWPAWALMGAVMPASAGDVVVGLAVAGGMVALLLVGILRSRTPFEQASLVFSKRVARIMREGMAREQGQKSAAAQRDYAPFALAATGPVWVAIAWKNLIAIGPRYAPRNLLAGLVAAAVVGLSLSAWLEGDAQLVVVMVALWIATFVWIMLTQKLQHDLRGDLSKLEVLRGLPIGGAELLLGEALGTAAIGAGVGAVCWTLAVCALSTADGEALPALGRCAAWAGGVGALVGVTLAFQAVGNALTMLFPAWSRPGTPGQGVAMLGQNLLQMLARMVGMLVLMLPAAVAVTLVVLACLFVMGRGVVGVSLAILAGGLTAGVGLALEAMVVIWVIGTWVYPRIEGGEVAG